MQGRALVMDSQDGRDIVAAGGEPVQFVTFAVGDEEYAVDIMAVREIKGWSETTAIPKAPDYVRGVINLRGLIVPIYDLRARFGLGRTEPTKLHVVIIVTISTRIIGILVDAVSDILTVDRGDIRPVPDIERHIDARFVAGLVALERRLVTLIELESLLLNHPGDGTLVLTLDHAS